MMVRGTASHVHWQWLCTFLFEMKSSSVLLTVLTVQPPSIHCGHCTPKTNLLVYLLRQAGFEVATVVSVPIPNTVYDNLEGNGEIPFLGGSSIISHR